MTDLLFRQQTSYSHVLAREFSISLLRLKEFYLLVKFSGSAKLHIGTLISGGFLNPCIDQDMDRRRVAI